jgi:hypothetical protein
MKRRSSESGYAMLLVFVLAAAIAIALYMELPRFMFERQREKEQLLIDRGEQYSLAIRRYYAKFQKWPTTMDDLENTNNIRFLRRQYKDPMTGKADWRIIHEAAGVLTDSLVHTPQQQQANTNGASGTPSNSTFGSLTSSNPVGSSMTASSATGSQEPPPKAPGLLYRPSDRGPLGTAHGGVSPDQNGMAGFDNNDQSAGLPPYAPENTPPSDAANQNAAPNAPSGQNPNSPQNPNPGQNPAQNPNSGQYPGQNSNPGQGITPPGFGPGGPSPAPGGGPGANPAINQIQQSLFGPRQFPTNPTAATSQNQTLSGGGIGIAGVASKAEFEGIKRYRDQSAYNKWEFTYDNSTMQQMQQQQTPQGQTGMGTNSPFQTQPQPQPSPSTAPNTGPQATPNSGTPQL